MTDVNYLILEVAAVTALVLFALIIVVSYPRRRMAWLLSLVCLSGASYLLTRMSFKSDDTYQLDLGILALPIQVLTNLGAGAWMLFCYLLFQDKRRIPPLLLSLFFLQVVLSLARISFIPMDMNELDRSQLDTLTRLVFLQLPLVLQGGFGAFALFLTIKGWTGDLVNSRRLIRWPCIAYSSLLFTSVTLTEILLIGADASERIVMNNGITLFAALSACAIVVIASRVDTALLDSAFDKIATVTTANARVRKPSWTEADYRRFLDVFENRRAYLQHGLTIGELANKMAIPEYRLRHLIHSRLGYRNFNALLHAYRINDACVQLADEGKKETPVLTIALSVGYQSIAPFNKAFRDIVGQTPTSYRTARSFAEQPAATDSA